MSDLRTAAQQALEALQTVFMPFHPAVIDLKAALAEEALQRLTDVHQEIEAALEQPEPEQEPKSTWQKLYEAAIDQRNEAVAEVKRLLEQPEQEPVACPHRDEPRGCYRVRCQLGRKCVEPLYTRPPRREWPKFTLSCGCPSQYGGVPAYWDRDGSTAFGMICEKHWHEYGARSEA